ncbi:dipeptidase [soil metagenome]
MPDTLSNFPIFDGHNDVLLRLFMKNRKDAEILFLDGEDDGHLDLPRALKGGFGGGMFAVFTPSPEGHADIDTLMQADRYDVPLPHVMTSQSALPSALAMSALLFRIERASKGRVKVCRSAKEIRDCLAKGVLATVLHIEGAEAIDADLNALEVLYQAGLRSIGPVWSRPTIFGNGVPFRFPSEPDTGPGLTETGMALVKACNELKIAIDLSHLNEKGFWDVAKLSNAPLIATHSNAHAVCPHSRNLTDRQLAAIRDSGGMVGINFATCFLRPDGRMMGDTPLEVMFRHLDHLVQQVGIDHVGFGSDFDGAKVPDAIGDVAGLLVLRDALAARGYTDETLRKLCSENWLNVLERTWGA